MTDMAYKRVYKKRWEKKKKGVGQYILLFLVFLFTVFCFAPVLLVFISAFTDEMYINQHGFSFFPAVWSMNGINSVLRYGSQLLRSYGVTIFITVAGTLLGLLIMSMYAYSIS
ncbi:MAG: carbohydrate ABC transporter permease, partial [Clostridia bacterium]|nr:carbohydrate ABC transporter permease [Clostridia bacterium]